MSYLDSIMNGKSSDRCAFILLTAEVPMFDLSQEIDFS